jgi:hypothetical protein
MIEHPRIEMRTTIGFALCFAAVFAIGALVPEGKLSGEQIEGLFVIAMCCGYVNHGVWHQERETIVSSLLGIVAVGLALWLAPRYIGLGWLVLGLGLAVGGALNIPRTQGHSSTHIYIGAFVCLGGVMRLLSVHLPTTADAMVMSWFVVVGLVFITLGREIDNPAWHYVGLAWIVAVVVTFTFRPQWMMLSTAAVFVVGMVANFAYLNRLLGRTPKLGELLSFATRALFLKGLKKPIDQYGVVAILTKGNVAAQDAIRDILSRLEPRCIPIVLLGPTAPTQLSLPPGAKVAWVSGVSGVAGQDVPILSPEDPTEVNVFLTKALQDVPKGMKAVILGDFLDNMIPHMDESLYYRYYSDLASQIRVLNHTIVLIVNADIHSEAEVSVVKRFADVIIENREREERGHLVREVRVSNRVDNINTDWERY